MFKKYFQKYQGIFASVTLFMVFFLAYLLLNYFIQDRAIKEVQYASIFSNLQERVTDINNKPGIVTELELLNAGGVINLPDGSDTKWPSLSEYLSPESANTSQILNELRLDNLVAAKTALGELADKVASKRDKKVKLVKTLQVVAAVLTLILYAMVIIPLIMRLSDTDVVEVESKREADWILNTVGEGLFLLDGNYDIGVEQSLSLKDMFRSEKDLEGNFFDFISQYVPQGTVKIAQDYIKLLFGDRVKEKLVEELNPLHQVEINIMRRDGSYENNYLDFKFKRVLIDNDVSHLLCSVTDVTKQVRLEQQLLDTKEEQEAQLDLLMSILHVDSKQLSKFFDSAEASLTNINKTLEGQTNMGGEIRVKLRQIARKVHQLKGDAAALGLNKFEFAVHAFEEELEKVQTGTEKITGKELIPAITQLRNMFSELSNMRSLVEKFAKTFSVHSGNPADISEASNDDAQQLAEVDQHDKALNSSLYNLVETIAKRNEKRVHFTSYGIDDENIPESLLDTVNSAATQLIRNSIIHGAEKPQERVTQGKTDFANLLVSFTALDNQYQLIVRDDGRGIDWQSVIDRAVELSLISEQEASKMDPSQAVSLLFRPGFSSKEEADLDAGRGVGLDVVYQLVKDKNGKVSVQSQKDKYCQFKLVFPKVA